MSNKERAIELLNQVPDYKMGYVLAYIQGITADEEADEESEKVYRQASSKRKA